MLNKFVFISALALSMAAGTAHAGISKNNHIAKGGTLLLGGTHPKTISFDGQNRGDVAVEILLQKGQTRTVVGSIAPGKRFVQYVPKNQIMVIRNKSDDQRAKVYWHVSGYSDRLKISSETSSTKSLD